MGVAPGSAGPVPASAHSRSGVSSRQESRARSVSGHAASFTTRICDDDTGSFVC